MTHIAPDSKPFERVFAVHRQHVMFTANALQSGHERAAIADHDRPAPGACDRLSHFDCAAFYPAFFELRQDLDNNLASQKVRPLPLTRLHCCLKGGCHRMFFDHKIYVEQGHPALQVKPCDSSLLYAIAMDGKTQISRKR